ncbi:MAG TPA: class I SAM-dependent methyltransferase [Methanosarcinaceae archaeon]|nr:class I SAM-dependent methyltransferase [Methanosarcinaceae archaeon]HJH31293.1 class I SAM-dependent methyltransferase [Methanosarcinaceae archaeon]
MDVKSIIRLYWDKRSQTYGKNTYRSPDEAQHLWKGILKNAICTDERLRILDVGIGTGFLALLFSEMGHNVTGIDISKCMLSKTRCNADKMGLNVDLIHADAENLPVKDEYFDIVINRHLLWTIPNPGTAVNEWSRTVRTGGKIILIDGKWHDYAIDMRLRRFISKMLVFMTEKRDPRLFTSHYDSIKDRLQFFYGSTPDNVIDLFSKAGLKNISMNNLEELEKFETKNRPLAYRIANKPSLYLAIGEK